MELRVSLNEEDFLQHQLYRATYREDARRNRNRARYVVSGLYMAFGILVLLISGFNDRSGHILITASVAWWLLHPIYSRWRYKSHFRRYVRQSLGRRVGIEADIAFDEESLMMKDAGTESAVRYSELENVIETPDYLYVMLKRVEAIIIPKRYLGDGKKEDLIELLQQKGLAYVDDTGWEWK